MMLLLRALVILGAVLAVISCGFAEPLALESSGGMPGGSAVGECNRVPLSKNLGTVPAAGTTVSASTGAGLCL